MRKDKEQATIMRRAGMTYSEIKDRMGVPLSTLSDWFRDQKWSNDIAMNCVLKARNGAAMRLMVLNTVRGSRLKKIYEDAKQDALVDFHELKFHPLFMTGVMVYWAHGDKTSKNRISVSSSDFNVIKIWDHFLENICGSKKQKMYLLLREDRDENACKSVWSEKCGFKYELFGKSSRIKGNSSDSNLKNNLKRRSVKPDYGVCNIVLSSAYLKNKILKWIELLGEEVASEKYVTGEV